MPRQQPIEIFMPPNMLKAKVGGSFSGMDPALVKRAEGVMEELKTEFGNWLSSDVDNLVASRERYSAAINEETRADLFRAAHDLKGGAQTYEYPLIARIASSLCKLIDGMPPTETIPGALVDAHVDAIRVLFKQGIKDGTNNVAIRLYEELEARVTETLEKVR
jgi:chemotaxis protein histidine kinase CheA